jgi:hypothetical protein
MDTPPPTPSKEPPNPPKKDDKPIVNPTWMVPPKKVTPDEDDKLLDQKEPTSKRMKVISSSKNQSSYEDKFMQGTTDVADFEGTVLEEDVIQEDCYLFDEKIDNLSPYPPAKLVQFYCIGVDTTEWPKMQTVLASIRDMVQKDESFYENIVSDDKMNNVCRNVFTNQKKLSEFLHDETFKECIIEITASIKTRLLLGLLQRRLVARLYQYGWLVHRKKEWAIATNELSSITNIAINWNYDNMREVTIAILLELEMDVLTVAGLSYEDCTLEKLLPLQELKDVSCYVPLDNAEK